MQRYQARMSRHREYGLTSRTCRASPPFSASLDPPPGSSRYRGCFALSLSVAACTSFERTPSAWRRNERLAVTEETEMTAKSAASVTVGVRLPDRPDWFWETPTGQEEIATVRRGVESLRRDAAKQIEAAAARESRDIPALR